MNGYNNERDEVSEAAAGLMRAMARGMPYIMWGAGVGLMLNFVLSSPFEVSCKTVEVRRAPKAVIEAPVTELKGEVIAAPMKSQAEE